MSNSTVVQFNIQSSDALTQNVKPLLHEIKHALDNLLKTGDSTVIDLRSIPLAPGEENTILEILGIGEVKAELDALGLSEVNETQYSGVWLVTHYNDEDEIIGRFIEITKIPEILRAQEDDMLLAYDHLDKKLADPSVEKTA